VRRWTARSCRDRHSAIQEDTAGLLTLERRQTLLVDQIAGLLPTPLARLIKSTGPGLADLSR
jgi:hypothetical protein